MNTRRLRTLIIALGAFAVIFGFWCLSEMPKQLILRYISQTEIIGAETVDALNLMGTFSVILGWSAAAIALFWPEVIEHALAEESSQVCYRASLVATSILLFVGLATGIPGLHAYNAIIGILLAGVGFFFLEWWLSGYVARVWAVVFNRWTAFAGYLAAGAWLFQVRFPFSTWNHYIFSRDYPMFQYTIWLDYKVALQGWLYGWEPSFSGGYPTFLNLRSLLLPYLPFAALPPTLGFHLMIFSIYVGVPLLCYWVAWELSEDRDIAVLTGWAGVWAMTGYMWHILHWGMMPTFTSIPFMMLALGFFIRAMKGSRWGVFLSAVFWAPVAYIHLGHFAHVALALFVLAGLYAWEERSLRAVWAMARTTLVAALLAGPYILEFVRYREHVILTNMFSYPAETAIGTLRIFLQTLARFIPIMNWHWSARFEARGFPDYAYFALFTVFLPVVLYLAFSGERSHRMAGLLYTGAIMVSALSFVPRFELSFQRMLYMVPPLLALAVGFWMGEAKKRGHLLPFYVIAILFFFYMRPFIQPAEDRTRQLNVAIPTLAERGDFDRAVIDRIGELPGGAYILFENIASLSPYADLARDFEQVEEEWDVHPPGFVHLETGKRLFSHPGYNPHPYYTLRGTYIATGTYEGQDVTDYGHDFFADLWRRWGVEYLCLWSRQSRRFFGGAPEYENILEGERFAIYRFRDADARAVAVRAGSAELSYPDNFTAKVRLDGVPAGSRVVLRVNWFDEWRATWDGEPVELYEHEGQISFDAPEGDGTLLMNWPKRRGLLLWPALAVAAGVFLSLRRML